MNRYTLLLLTAVVLLASCGRPKVPAQATPLDEPAALQPAYADSLCIPCNIAPLNCCVEGDGEAVVCVSAPDGSQLVGKGSDTQFDVDDWHRLLAAAKGQWLTVDIYQQRQGTWRQLRPLHWYVAPDSIDPYLVYRLIEPSYVAYEQLIIEQRSLQDFTTRTVYDNMAQSENDHGQCVNCHSFQQWNATGRMQMHFRQNYGGTLVALGDTLQHISIEGNQETEGGVYVRGGVYPSWHPSLPLIAYSVNTTGQNFHTRDLQKVEVLDYASDLILYDAQAQQATYICRDTAAMQTFPSWSADGRTLFYAEAPFLFVTDDVDTEMANRYQEVKYNLMARPFDPQTHSFGQPDTVFCAQTLGRSATLPRQSPDGRYLLFTLGDYGNFHVWHRSADLALMDMQTRELVDLSALNSPEAESWHAWSSNGRWIVFSSRCEDGNYTRPYIAYFDREGRAHRPFPLPQRQARHSQLFLRSYNVPEFIVQPVAPSARQIGKAMRGEGEEVRL